MHSTERLITLLASVNGTAIDNDLAAGRTIGQHIQEICHEAAGRLLTVLSALDTITSPPRRDVANLGFATTRDLLAEISARIECHTEGGLDYRTVSAVFRPRL
jgi:hypothetical protein